MAAATALADDALPVHFSGEGDGRAAGMGGGWSGAAARRQTAIQQCVSRGPSSGRLSAAVRACLIAAASPPAAVPTAFSGLNLAATTALGLAAPDACAGEDYRFGAAAARAPRGHRLRVRACRCRRFQRRTPLEIIDGEADSPSDLASPAGAIEAFGVLLTYNQGETTLYNRLGDGVTMWLKDSGSQVKISGMS